MSRCLLVGLIGLVAVTSGCVTPTEESETRPVGKSILTAAQLREAKVAVDFSRHVKPILEERCVHCHNAETMPGKFSLESRQDAMAGGRIVPGDAKKSLLIYVLNSGNHAMSMPSVGEAPPEEEIEVLRQWVDEGASWPAQIRLEPQG